MISYKRRRLPPEIISYADWLYRRFNMSFREVEELLLERGIGVSYETTRRWVAKFGPAIAQGLRRHHPQPDDIWHLDEVVVTIKGRKFWLWRAVDQDGLVLDEILQSRRNIRVIHAQSQAAFISPALRFTCDRPANFEDSGP